MPETPLTADTGFAAWRSRTHFAGLDGLRFFAILGVLFGTLIVGIMSMGLNMMNADPQWKVLLTGVLIIAAVAVDQWIRKVSS